ncbi:MAG: diguanylate cyclase [Pseudobacteriovorax sp.]|nr:diguanylate cyclase [Pseudobacteriovorax sp.]
MFGIIRVTSVFMLLLKSGLGLASPDYSMKICEILSLEPTVYRTCGDKNGFLSHGMNKEFRYHLTLTNHKEQTLDGVLTYLLPYAKYSLKKWDSSSNEYVDFYDNDSIREKKVWYFVPTIRLSLEPGITKFLLTIKNENNMSVITKHEFIEESVFEAQKHTLIFTVLLLAGICLATIARKFVLAIAKASLEEAYLCLFFVCLFFYTDAMTGISSLLFSFNYSIKLTLESSLLSTVFCVLATSTIFRPRYYALVNMGILTSSGIIMIGYLFIREFYWLSYLVVVFGFSYAIVTGFYFAARHDKYFAIYSLGFLLLAAGNYIQLYVGFSASSYSIVSIVWTLPAGVVLLIACIEMVSGIKIRKIKTDLRMTKQKEKMAKIKVELESLHNKELASSIYELKEYNRVLESLFSMKTLQASSNTVSLRLDQVCQQLSQVFKCPVVMMIVGKRRDYIFKLSASNIDESSKNRLVDIHQQLSPTGYDRSKFYHFLDQRLLVCANTVFSSSHLLSHKANMIKIFLLTDSNVKRSYHVLDFMISTLSTAIVETIEIEEKKQQVQIDKLTGCFNQDYWQDFCVIANDMMVRSHQGFCIVFADVDRLKPINDRYGHKFGDSLIKTIGKLLLAYTRGNATVFRLSGDEFAIHIPNCSLADTTTFVESIKLRLSQERLECLDDSGDSYRESISASFGIASSEEVEQPYAENTLELADNRMFENKKKAKMNRVG